MSFAVFFARYKDIFGQWFAVTPQFSITEPPGTLDLESLQKKVEFDLANDIDLNRGGVYDPDAVDDLYHGLKGIVTKKWSSTNWQIRLVTSTPVNISFPS